MSWWWATPVGSCWCTRTTSPNPGSPEPAWAWWVPGPKWIKRHPGLDPPLVFWCSSWPASPLEMFAIKERFVETSRKWIFCGGGGSGRDVMCVCFILFCQNFVVAVGAEGWFHLFDLSAVSANKADSSSQHEFTTADDPKPLFTQHIPANTKVILISDIGKCSNSVVHCHCGLGYRICTIRRWWWPLRAGCGLHRPGSASIPLGRANRQYGRRNRAAYPVEEMAPRGAGRTLAMAPCVFSLWMNVWSLENQKLIYCGSSSELVVLNSRMCHAGGQFVCKPRSRGFTRTDGVPARLWLCYSALLLDAAGLQWIWRGGPCHSWEV